MITRPSRGIARATVVLSLAVIAFLTLRPADVSLLPPASCIFCGPLGGVDFLLNTALFVPLGLGLRWLLGQWRLSVIIGAATTLVIETLQWRSIPGRDTSLGDLLANTLGTMLGAWLAVRIPRWLNATGVAARPSATAFSFLTAAIAALSSWLLMPVQPRWAQFTQWSPRRVNMDTFTGRLVSVELNGRPIHATEGLRPWWTFDAATRTVSVRADMSQPNSATSRHATIIRIANDFEEGFFLGQWGRTATFRSHMVGVRLKLRPILVGLDDALPVPGNDTEQDEGVLTIRALSNPRAMTITRSIGGEESTLTVRRSIGLAWALLLPRDVPLNPKWWPANALWLGILVFPAAFLTLRSGSATPAPAGRRMTWWPFLLVGATLVTAPAVFGLSALGFREWLGIAVAVGAAAALERRTAPPSVLGAQEALGTIPR